MAIDLANLQGIGGADADVCGPDGVCAVPERPARVAIPHPPAGTLSRKGRGPIERATLPSPLVGEGARRADEGGSRTAEKSPS
jgi:hypothetical protein